MTKPFFKLHAAALAALLCAAGTAQAKTWVLSSDKTGLSGYVLGANIVNSIYSTFEAASGGAANMEDGRGLLHASNSSALPSVPADVDVVVVATVEGNWGAGRGVNPDRFDEVMALVQNRRDLTFVFLNDGCCRPADQTALTGALNTALGLSGPDAISFEAPPAPASAGTQFYVNTNSPYQGSFATPNPVEGVDYRKYTNLPAPYVVYLAGNTTNTAPAMPAPTGKADAYGLLIPRAATNGGACVIAFGDTSHFLTNAPSQPAQLAQNIMNAARLDSGACQSKTVATPDLVATITPPALSVGATGTVQVQVSNNGLTPNINGQIVIDLPAGLKVASATLPPGCIRNSAARVTCTVPIIPNGTPLSLPIPVQATAITAPGVQISAAIRGNTGELGPQQGNNTAMAPVAVTAAPAPVAVPTLDIWGLGALAALLGAMGLRQRRRSAR